MSEKLPQASYLSPEVLQNLGNLELIAREVVEGLRVGQHRSALRGFSTEFSHHRQYASGDAIRDIDWRVYGRTGRYFTKLYEAETNFECTIVMDASASMTYGSGKVNKLEYAKYLAASLAYIVLKQRDSIGLSIFDSQVRTYLPPRSSMNVIAQIDRLLKDIQPLPRNTVAKQLHDIALMMKRKSFVIIISDFLSDIPDVKSALDHLRFNGHNVIVLHTMDPYELDFPFKGAWQFDGLERNGSITTQGERVREDYLENLNKYLDDLRSACISSGVDYSLINTSQPLDLVLSEFFNQRQTGLLSSSIGSER